MNTQNYFEEYDDEYVVKIPEKSIEALEALKKDRKKKKRKIDKLKSINNRRLKSDTIIDVTKPWKRQFFRVTRKQVKPSNEPVLGVPFKNEIRPS